MLYKVFFIKIRKFDFNVNCLKEIHHPNKQLPIEIRASRTVASYVPYAFFVLLALKLLKGEFIVHQKVTIFQKLLKALQTDLSLCESKNSHDTF